MNNKRPKADPWMQGYACACGIIAHLLGADEGQRIAREGGFNRKDFVKAKCEQYDVDKIYPLDRDE